MRRFVGCLRDCLWVQCCGAVRIGEAEDSIVTELRRVGGARWGVRGCGYGSGLGEILGEMGGILEVLELLEGGLKGGVAVVLGRVAG